MFVGRLHGGNTQIVVNNIVRRFESLAQVKLRVSFF
jgi:hypothetical protein